MTVDVTQELRERVSGIAATAARLVKRAGLRLDAISLDLARDAGVVARDAQAFAADASAFVDTVRGGVRATPRVLALGGAAARILARQRWLRLRAVARGHATLSADDHRELAAQVVAAASELRGGIAKIGQLASCRADLVGPVWARELARLQDQVAPVEASAIRARIEAELGQPLAAVFATFDDVPLAAASLAQVHAATLHDGTAVVVKVQAPGIEDVIAADIAALRTLASALAGSAELPGTDVPTLTDELARALAAELDYVAEAAALAAFAAHASAVRSPRAIRGASSARVLTMTRIDGERITAYLDRADAAERDRVLGAFVTEIATEILERGVVHADPHPGNVLVTPAGELALLDFGCTLALSAVERAAYARLVIAIAGGQQAGVARELAALGFIAEDPAALVVLATSLVGALRPGAAVAELDWEHAVADQLAAAKRVGGLVIPRSFVLLGRVLATLAGLLATYKPRLQLYPLLATKLAAAAAAPSPADRPPG